MVSYSHWIKEKTQFIFFNFFTVFSKKFQEISVIDYNLFFINNIMLVSAVKKPLYYLGFSIINGNKLYIKL